jgi:mRNA-degrading endonuclease RelE of RelBE toxin-antitoxin system
MDGYRADMSYRILVEPAAGQRLRTFASHVVQRLGRLLAELADLASIAPPPSLLFARNPGPEPNLLRMEIDDVTVWYRVDNREETLTVVEVASTADDQPGAQAG